MRYDIIIFRNENPEESTVAHKVNSMKAAHHAADVLVTPEVSVKIIDKKNPGVTLIRKHSKAEPESQAIKNTRIILETFRGLPHEFGMLKGLIVVDFDLDRDQQNAYRKLVDTQMIAVRMDEITKNELLKGGA